jgi:hypothetical protein
MTAVPTTLAGQAWALAFAPLSVAEGIVLREAARWRHLPGANPARFQDLLSVADLDAFLRTDAARSPRVSMAESARKGSASVPEEEFADANGRVELPRLLARFDAGATLVVSQFHELHAPLARFCRGLERVFLHPVQANIYLTPPGAQGFRVHYDTHDVIVLQVRGTKRWRVWPGQPVPHPTRRTPWSGGDGAVQPEGEPVTLALGPGDALYLPRGVMHDAEVEGPRHASDAEASLHITVGLLEPSWAEAMRHAVNALEAERAEGAALREAFPSWRLADPDAIGALAREMAARLAALATPVALDRVALRLMDRLATERLALPSRGLLTPPPGPHDRLQLTGSMHHHLVPLDGAEAGRGGAVLRWAGGAETLDATRLGWLERLEAGATPAELGGGEDGGEDALGFCRRLAARGLLERIGGGDA